MERNYNAIDIVKLLMALFVVAIHVHPEECLDNFDLKDIIRNLYSLAVPFFFTASGLFLWNKLKNKSRDVCLMLLRRWLKRITRLYILWTIIYLPYTIYGLVLEDNSIGKSFLIFIRNVLLVGENYLSWPLWYLLAMIVAGCIIYLAKMCKFTDIYILYGSLLFILVGFLIENYHWDAYFSLFKTTRNGLFYGFPYMMIGVFLSSFSIVGSNYVKIFLLILGLSLQMNKIEIGRFLTIYAIYSIILSSNWDKWDGVCETFRITSTVFYFVHMLWVGLFIIFSPTISPLNLFIMVILLCSLTAYMVIKNKERKIVKLLFR